MFADTLKRLIAIVVAAVRPQPGRWASPRRLGLMLVFLSAVLLVQAVNLVCLLLDEVLFPAYRKVAITEPVIVLGVPRSGTTFLHRVLARDPDLTTFRTWECLLAPSITQRRVILGLAALDRGLGGAGARLLRWLERRAFASLEDIHAMDLMAPEEDYMALLPVFACFVLVIPFPGAEALWRIGRGDHALTEGERRRLMAYYRACLQRHLYVHGPDKRLLSKNAAFAGLAGSLRETFPDARVLVCERDPLSVVPSQLSSIQDGVGLFDSDPQGTVFPAHMLETLAFAHHNLARVCPPDAPASAGCLRLDMTALNRDLVAEVAGAYRRLGLPLSEAFRAALVEEAGRARRYRSRHAYSLADFALDEATVLRHFKDASSQGTPLPPAGGREC